MTIEKMNTLAARLLGEKATDLGSALKAIENLMPVPESYRDILMTFGGALVFDNGAKFKTDEPSPLNDEDGYQSLEVIYGPGSGKHSIEHQIARFEGELPPSFIPIGEAPGGNLVCVDGKGTVYLWDHESMRDEGVWRVSASINEFFDKLEPDESDIGSTDGIVDSESFLDF